MPDGGQRFVVARFKMHFDPGGLGQFRGDGSFQVFGIFVSLLDGERVRDFQIQSNTKLTIYRIDVEVVDLKPQFLRNRTDGDRVGFIDGRHRFNVHGGFSPAEFCHQRFLHVFGTLMS